MKLLPGHPRLYVSTAKENAFLVRGHHAECVQKTFIGVVSNMWPKEWSKKGESRLVPFTSDLTVQRVYIDWFQSYKGVIPNFWCINHLCREKVVGVCTMHIRDIIMRISPRIIICVSDVFTCIYMECLNSHHTTLTWIFIYWYLTIS